MQIQKLSFILPFIAIASVLIPSSAEATTITFGGTSSATTGVWSSVADTKGVSIETPKWTSAASASPVAYTMSGGTIHSGSYIDYYLAPKNDSSRYESVAFGQSEIDFKSSIKYFGLYWGSIDMYNSISLISGKTVQTYSGAQIATLFTSETGKGVQYGDTAMYVNFAAENGATWNKILLKSTGWSFESANLAYETAASVTPLVNPGVSAVPEPSTMLGVFAGVGLLAVALSRKRTISLVAA